jgi:hypothetical protein
MVGQGLGQVQQRGAVDRACVGEGGGGGGKGGATASIFGGPQ